MKRWRNFAASDYVRLQELLETIDKITKDKDREFLQELNAKYQQNPRRDFTFKQVRWLRAIYRRYLGDYKRKAKRGCSSFSYKK